MPWVITPRPPRRRGPIERVFADRERLLAWSAAGIAILVLLGFWFAVAHKIA